MENHFYRLDENPVSKVLSKGKENCAIIAIKVLYTILNSEPYNSISILFEFM